MYVPQRFSAALALAAAVTLSTGAASAQGLSGSYPVTISSSGHSNGTDCLTLTDNGGYGWKHSGSAAIVIGSTKYPYGTFQLINRLLVVTIEAQGYGQNAGLVFIAPTAHGGFGKGTYDEVYGGEEFDSGGLTFGMKGGC